MKKKLGFDLVILGDSASGKDTQAEILQKKYDLYPVASGAYFRKLLKNPKYKAILEKTYSKGLPAPTQLVLDLLKESFRKIKPNQNFIFIGAARLKPEAVVLKKYLDGKNRNFLVIYIKLAKAEVIKRSVKRGRIEDQDSKFIANRFLYYKKQVSQTVAYYRLAKKLKFINGNQTVGAVAKDIEQALNDYKR
jgi:adenylate kinase family enzyme